MGNTPCTFCHKFRPPHSNFREWYDAILAETAHFLVIPSIGAFAEGCLMIVSKEHQPSIAHLPSSTIPELVALKTGLVTYLTKAYKKPVIFEHGAADSLGGGGSCINHAHLNLYPLPVDTQAMLVNYGPLVRIFTYDDLSNQKGKPYVFVEDGSGTKSVFPGDRLPGQFFRRLIAKSMGLADEWDYAVFPRFAKTSATIFRCSDLGERLEPFMRCQSK